MASWVLDCAKCELKFTHSMIEDAGLVSYFLTPKPQFPPGGSEFACPNCGYKAMYQRTDLKYLA
jgi:hypothetical protein